LRAQPRQLGAGQRHVGLELGRGGRRVPGQPQEQPGGGRPRPRGQNAAQKLGVQGRLHDHQQDSPAHPKLPRPEMYVRFWYMYLKDFFFKHKFFDVFPFVCLRPLKKAFIFIFVFLY